MKPAISLLIACVMFAACSSSPAGDAGDSGNADTIVPADVTTDVPDAMTDSVAGDTVRPDGGTDTGDSQIADVFVDSDADVPQDAAIDLPGDTAGADTTIDAGGDVMVNCTGWSLVNSALTGAVMDDPAPLNAARTTRFRASFVLKCNETRATPQVTVDPVARTVVVRPMVWKNAGIACAGADLMDERIISVLPAASGTWKVLDGAGAEKLMFEVGEAPAGVCLQDSHSDCEKDCDCADGVCLGGNGLVGPFTMCGRPCEYNQDCPSENSCISADDGLSYYCEPMQNCLDAGFCPDGFQCESKFCVPRYELNQSARHECTCDSECTPPLRCVEPAGAQRVAVPVRRCEYACPSAGGWCPGAHVCGAAKDDVSGMAGTDSVCIWMGE